MPAATAMVSGSSIIAPRSDSSACRSCGGTRFDRLGRRGAASGRSAMTVLTLTGGACGFEDGKARGKPVDILWTTVVQLWTEPTGAPGTPRSDRVGTDPGDAGGSVADDVDRDGELHLGVELD